MMFQFDSMGDFLTMAGHGAYVWASYLITIIAIVMIAVIPVIQKRNLAKQIKRQLRIESSGNDSLKGGR